MAMILEAVTVAEAVAARLRTQLLAGDLPGGTELRDTVLAAELGVARPTVRAAVQALVAEGLLERTRGHSARVRTFGIEDAADLYRVRQVLEVEAIEAILTEKIGLERIDKAYEQFAALTEADTWDQVNDADLAFHRAVVETTGSPRLLRLFDSLSNEFRLLIAQLRPSYDSIAEAIEEHRTLVDALHAGKVHAAVAEWRGHLKVGQAFLLRAMEDNQKG
jgi:DNA-binding GntR family transcriptional regulator